MKIHNVVQGSPEWLALRARHLCASDAPAMMGASSRTKRTDLVRMRATGDGKEFTAWEQENLLNRGHATETAIRTYIEGVIDGELYPITASDDGEKYLASFDGLTMSEDTGFEHKLWNEDLAAAVRAGSNDLPGGHHWQLEQQLMISGAERIIFACSDGTPQKCVWMEYRPVQGRREQLLAGWKQFEDDVANYQHVEVPLPLAGKVVRDLPALLVQVEGKVVTANLTHFREIALGFIDSINTTLETDQDFADAEQNIKGCEKAEGQLENAKTAALAQTADIDALFRTMDELKESMRQKRLSLTKLVQARKEAKRADILRGGKELFTAHVAALNGRLGQALMPTIADGFADAMKGKKTISSLQDAVNTELARLKIASNEIADKLQGNLKLLEAEGKDHRFLFNDLSTVVHKAPDDFAMLVRSRITEHKQAEAKKEEDQRERIRQEEAQKLAIAQPVAPAAAAPVPAAATATQPAPIARGKRPTDAQIVEVVATHWRVTAEKATAWLLELNLKSAKKKAA